MWIWRLTQYEAGRPLLAAVALRLPAVPPGLLRQLLRKGRISCNGEVVREERIVPAGALIALRPSLRLDELVAAGGLPPESLLFEDQQVLVLAKPAGLAVHRAAGSEDHLHGRVNRLLALRRAPYQAHPVHRLDIGTSGAVLFAKGKQAAGAYGRLLMAGQLDKRYLALVTGNVPGAGELLTPVPAGGRLKAALSRYRRLATAGNCSLLELELVTGRTHQARRQLADAGWPIVGDDRYGGSRSQTLGHPWLHCRQLSFPGLDGAGRHRVVAPLPTAHRHHLAGLGFDLPSLGEEFLSENS